MKVLKYILTGILFMGLVANPVLLKAAEGEELMSACNQARFDAQRDVPAGLWVAIGFFTNIFGIAAANVIDEIPPASRLIGKSPEYVRIYTDCYKSATKEIQTKNAIKGCVTSGLLVIAISIYYYAVHTAAEAMK